MTSLPLEELIRNAIIASLSERVAQTLESQRRAALVVVTDTDIGLGGALDGLQSLRAEGWSLRTVADAGAWAVIGAARGAVLGLDHPVAADADVDALLDGQSMVLVPALSITIAAKVAAVIRDCLASRILARALERGLPVVAAWNGCCPDNRDRHARGFQVTDAYKARMRANMDALKSYGITMVAARKLGLAAGQILTPVADARTQPVAVEGEHSGGKRVFGRAEAMQCQGPELRLGRDVLVTPLAVEELRHRNIRLVQA